MSDRQDQFKTGLGSGETITRRHAERQQDGLRKNREDRLTKLRSLQTLPVPVTSIRTCDIGSLNLEQLIMDPNPLEQLEILGAFLSRPESVQHYAPCPQMWPEATGPYLFTNPNVLQRLVQLLQHPDPDIRRLVIYCLDNVAGHELTNVWVPQLIQCGVIPFAKALIQTDSNVVFMFANMCADNPMSRNQVLEAGIIPLVVATINPNSSPELIFNTAFLLKACFIHGTNLPRSDLVLPLWNVMIRGVFLQRFGESVFDNKEEFETLCQLVKCIELLTRYSPEYTAGTLLQDSVLLNRLTKYVDSDFPSAVRYMTARIFEHISELLPQHLVRIIGDLVNIQCILMRDQELNVRVCGAMGLKNLTQHFSDSIGNNKNVLNTIAMQYENARQYYMQKELHLIMVNLVRIAPQWNDNYVPMVHYMSLLLQNHVAEGVLLRSVMEALIRLIKWRPSIANTVEETAMGGLERIEHLHEDLTTCSVAERLSALINNGDEEMIC